MDDRDMRLDGNAVAGLLQELFVDEMTMARGACGGCGMVSEIGAQHLYMYPHSPGAVLRCGMCDTVLMVLVHGEGRYRVGMPGYAWLEIHESASGA
jgi:hypothetical protein